ncbi:hypothetical protein [Micromonospora sp. DT47]|uniref:hypothetical protein n=1 Tax=Micromonospora sp. DT47 TaxID=3393431 RepID=UPI003CE6D786
MQALAIVEHIADDGHPQASVGWHVDRKLAAVCPISGHERTLPNISTRLGLRVSRNRVLALR